MCIGTQSKSLRYSNSNCDEIGVKFNRNRDTIILVENNEGVCKNFTFSGSDDQVLNYFENILTNMISYYNTFCFHYGRKTNTSNMGMSYKVLGEDGSSLEVSVNGELGIRFEIEDSDHMSASFNFSKEDKTVLEMFKTDLTNVLRNNIHKLPPVAVNASSDAEVVRTFSKN